MAFRTTIPQRSSILPSMPTRQYGVSAKSTRQTSVVVDFMGFPREVRDMVYEHALCMDGVLAPCAEIFKVNGDYAGPPPTVALLATNRQIRTEALPVLFGKNTWRITSEPKTISYRREETAPYHRRVVLPRSTRQLITTLLGRFGPLLRSVILDFNFQELDRTELVNKVHTPRGSDSADERMQVIHDGSTGQLVEHWIAKQCFFLWITKVTSCILDVNNTYCAFGCCRVEMLERLFGEDSFFIDIMVERIIKKGLTIPHFDFRGIRTEEEERLAERWQQALKERVLSEGLLHEAHSGIRKSPKMEKMEIGGISSHMIW